MNFFKRLLTNVIGAGIIVLALSFSGSLWQSFTIALAVLLVVGQINRYSPEAD